MYYGLPAAGILCLALLKGAFRNRSSTAISKAHRELHVLVAHVDASALADVDEPNHALLAEATATIKVVVKSALLQAQRDTGVAMEGEDLMLPQSTETWMPWPGIDSWDFELPFWTNLAEHPSLSTANGDG